MEPEKKISFGFSKLSKKPQILQKKSIEEKKFELIEALEGNTIKIKDAVATVDLVNEPLVIPIKDNKRNLLDRIRDVKNQRQKNQEPEEEVDTRPDSELTLDELAARELMNDAKKRLEQKKEGGKVFVLPMKDEKITEGEAEPTLDDYENIPISDYGMAMLRGMGWNEGMGIGKNQTKLAQLSKAPELRPKGLGLGANKMVKAEISKQAMVDKDGKELVLKQGAFAKIVAGAKKGSYCEVQGLDDEGGRVIVRTTLKGEILTLNEFLVLPVTKEEYSKCSKIINSAKYEEYKEKSNGNNGHNIENNEPSSSRFRNDGYSKDFKNINSKGKSKSHREKIKNENSDDGNDNKSSNRSADKYFKKEDSESDFESEDDKRKKGSPNRKKYDDENKSSRSSRRDESESDPSSDSEYEQKRKHHKKKDKRSRRDRSRSPSKRSNKKHSRHRRYSSSPDSAYEESRSKHKSKHRRSRSRDRKQSKSKK